MTCVRRSTLACWVLVAAAACATPGARAPDAEPSRVMPRPCSELTKGEDAGATRVARAGDAGAPRCCPPNYVLGGMASGDCPAWACCPIWEGMGNPPPMPDAPGIGNLP
jgi:hypothetical protein